MFACPLLLCLSTPRKLSVSCLRGSGSSGTEVLSHFGRVVLQAMLELSKEFPALHRPLIGERDQYMVSVLRTLAAE